MNDTGPIRPPVSAADKEWKHALDGGEPEEGLGPKIKKVVVRPTREGVEKTHGVAHPVPGLVPALRRGQGEEYEAQSRARAGSQRSAGGVHGLYFHGQQS